MDQEKPLIEVRFASPLRVERIAGGWKLLDEFRVEVAVDRRDTFYAAPAGFATDFASVPRMPIAYMLVGGRGVKAATLHDWLYTAKLTTRELADAIFHAALLAEGESEEVANLMWAGVRLGGEAYWNGAAGRSELAPSLPQPSFPY